MSGFIIYIIVSIISPGPNNIYASVSASKKGFVSTMPFMIGVWIGTSLVFLSSSFVTLELYQELPQIFFLIGILGGLFIIYLAYKMIFIQEEESKVDKGKHFFLLAIFLNFINPKALIFGLTIAAYYIEIGLNTNHIYSFSILMGLLCYLSVMLWALLGQSLRSFLQKYQKAYVLVMGALLFYSGLLIIIETLF